VICSGWRRSSPIGQTCPVRGVRRASAGLRCHQGRGSIPRSCR
jgi:hypothetical protein